MAMQKRLDGWRRRIQTRISQEGMLHETAERTGGGKTSIPRRSGGPKMLAEEMFDPVSATYPNGPRPRWTILSITTSFHVKKASWRRTAAAPSSWSRLPERVVDQKCKIRGRFPRRFGIILCQFRCRRGRHGFFLTLNAKRTRRQT
ncbi:hypothetical protein Ae201684_007350 [Aphanomyces euteiches]|uniref:Uncharacterized protein n=1 Tax=Aphanomyces euteiches TaxID=100861 RepID=A0A6G0X8H2_9STRA|nr:hypothetical protein Ae201684_007350 [Aphanomyces euteiches]